MDTRELKKTYYSLLANDPDYPAWEEFEWYCGDEWLRFTEDGINWSNFNKIRYNPKPKKWIPPNGNWFINPLTNSSYEIERVAQSYTWFGLARANKEQAEQDLKQIRQFCRFLAWRAENCCYSDAIVPALDYADSFLNNEDYCKLNNSINSCEVDL